MQARELSLNNSYTWPTWAPDGTKIAASRVRVSRDGADISIEVIDVGNGLGRTVYRNEASGLVAQGAPHYLYWAPDSKQLAFLASTPQGLTLFVKDLENQADPVAVDTGAPLYFHWATDSNSMVIHIGPEVKIARRPFESAPEVVVANAGGFRVPAVSNDGTRYAYTMGTGTGEAVFITSTDASVAATPVLEVGGYSAFVWSPDGSELAIADAEDPSGFAYNRLRVVAAESGEVRTIAEGPIVSFYWSPSGEKLAWVQVDRESRVFEWVMAPKEGAPDRSLFRFQPSTDSFTTLTFFDQYGYSHSPWSPDGTQLVVAGTQEQSFSRRNGQTATGDRIFVVDATGETGPQEIAAGTLAVWSWN